MRTPTSRGLVAATVIALSLGVAACGTVLGDESAPAETVPTTAISTERTTPGNPDTSLPTGDEICTELSAELVSSTLGLEIVQATPTSPTADVAPTCSYSFVDDDEKTASVSISVLRPFDMAGRIGNPGYDVFVAVLKSYAEGVDFTETSLNIGRESVRLDLPNDHAAIADSGKHVLRVLVPRDAAEPEQVDALLAAAVGAIG